MVNISKIKEYIPKNIYENRKEIGAILTTGIYLTASAMLGGE